MLRVFLDEFIDRVLNILCCCFLGNAYIVPFNQRVGGAHDIPRTKAFSKIAITIKACSRQFVPIHVYAERRTKEEQDKHNSKDGSFQHGKFQSMRGAGFFESGHHGV